MFNNQSIYKELQHCFWLWYVLQYFCLLKFFFCPCMAINVELSVQYNGGLLPDIILLTHCHYYHRGARLNAMKRFCFCSLSMIPPN